MEQLVQTLEVPVLQQVAEPVAVLRLFLVPGQMSQQAVVQALAHLSIRVAEVVDGATSSFALADDRQVAGLEQQRLGADVAHVEARHQFFRGHHAFQIHWSHAPSQQRLQQEVRRARLEPVRLEPPRAEQQQYVERVVHFLVAKPAVAVVPLANALPIKARELGGEHLVEVRLGVAANRGVPRGRG